MGEYLIGGVNSAHERYRPDDWKAADCRRSMSVRREHFVVFISSLSSLCFQCFDAVG